MSKGSKRRPGDRKAFDEAFDEINWKSKNTKKEEGLPKCSLCGRVLQMKGTGCACDERH